MGQEQATSGGVPAVSKEEGEMRSPELGRVVWAREQAVKFQPISADARQCNVQNAKKCKGTHRDAQNGNNPCRNLAGKLGYFGGLKALENAWPRTGIATELPLLWGCERGLLGLQGAEGEKRVGHMCRSADFDSSLLKIYERRNATRAFNRLFVDFATDWILVCL